MSTHQTSTVRLIRPVRLRHVLAVALAASAALAGCTAGLNTPSPVATPGLSTVDVTGARQQLASLTVQPPGPGTGYSPEKFPHWITIEGRCNTREMVLRRQGAHLRLREDCYPTAGEWVSPYDGAVWHKASDVDIDHLVPRSEAWRSGASGWSTARRTEFANDLEHPELVAVTDDLNAAKGDRDPAVWKPPLRSYWCTYAADWTEVKFVYRLTADRAEIAALGRMLDTCPGGQS